MIEAVIENSRYAILSWNRRNFRPNTRQRLFFHRSDGVVVRASASQSVDWGFDAKSSHTKRL